MVFPGTTSLRRPSPEEVYNERHPKGRRIGEQCSSSSETNDFMRSASPTFFGDFVRSCGGPSSSSSTSFNVVEVGSSTSGCFGISIGGGIAGRGVKLTRIPSEEEDDPTVLIAKAMNHLTIQEREQAYEDVHGVSATVHETPELIAETLHEMERRLQGVRHKPVYDMAMTMRADYVEDPKLRLMFLRADRFEVEKAVKRLLGFLDWKLRLFGPERLCQWHIGLDDLEEDSRFMVESGVFQILPARDSRGRAVIALSEYHHFRLDRSTQSALQSMYYMYQCLAEDEINQKTGVVAVAYCLAPEEVVVASEKRNSVWESAQLGLCLPIRGEASHFCMAKNGVHLSLALAAKGLGLFNRARLRMHFGSHVECMYALMSFGISSAVFPITSECELKTGNHKKWFQRRVIKEQELLSGHVFNGIELPSHKDILLGKGKPFQNHPGNRRLQDLVEGYFDEYNQANHNGGKTAVSHKILQEIVNPSGGGLFGGRFLKRREDKWNSGWWEEVTEEDAMIGKIGNSIRGVRKKNNIAQRVLVRPKNC